LSAADQGNREPGESAMDRVRIQNGVMSIRY
jgi:hypothetical protein